MERIKTEMGAVIACDENRNLTAMVMLTPNVSTLIDGDYEGADVKVLVTSIISDKRKIKSHLDSVLEMPGKRKVDYNQYITKNPLPEFLLLDDYKKEHGYFKRRGSAGTAQPKFTTSDSEKTALSPTESDKDPLAYFDSFLRSVAS